MVCSVLHPGTETKLADLLAKIGRATTALDRVVIEHIVDIHEEVPVVGLQSKPYIGQLVIVPIGKVLLVLEALVLPNSIDFDKPIHPCIKQRTLQVELRHERIFRRILQLVAGQVQRAPRIAIGRVGLILGVRALATGIDDRAIADRCGVYSGSRLVNEVGIRRIEPSIGKAESESLEK